MPTAQLEPIQAVKSAASREPTPFYLSSRRGPLFAWLHPGPSGAGHAVVFCPPAGHEQVHAHRAWRHLAEAVAGAGLPVLRFDYHGTGDSAGTDEDPDRLAAWRQDVRDAIAVAAPAPRVRARHARGPAPGGGAGVPDSRRGAGRSTAPVGPGRHRPQVPPGVARSRRRSGLVSARGRPAGCDRAHGLHRHRGDGRRPGGHRPARRAPALRPRPDRRPGRPARRRPAPSPPGRRAASRSIRWRPRVRRHDGRAALHPGPARRDRGRCRLAPVPTRPAAAGPAEPEVLSSVADGRWDASAASASGRAPSAGSHGCSASRPSRGGQHSRRPPVDRVPERRGRVPGRAEPAVRRTGPALAGRRVAVPCALDLGGIGDSPAGDPARENDAYPATGFGDIDRALAILGMAPRGPEGRARRASARGPTLRSRRPPRWPTRCWPGRVAMNPLTFFWQGRHVARAPTANRLAEMHYFMAAAVRPGKWLKVLAGRSRLGLAGRPGCS